METPPRLYAVPVYRVSLVRDSALKTEQRPILRNSEDAYNLLKDWFLDNDREEFVIIMLDMKNKVIGINSVSTGSISSSIVHPREVFKPLILHNAASVILSHNHPSGDPTPSAEDKAITKRLREVGDIMGIPVRDHVIVGDGRYVSFVDDGLWE